MKTLAKLFGLFLICYALNAAEISIIKGTVVDDSQKPVSGAIVELKSSEGGTGYYKCVTGRNGMFEFSNIQAGLRYDLEIYKEGYCEYSMRYWQLPPYQKEIKLVLPLVKSGTISGTISASDGSPIEGARIELEGNVRKTTFSAKDGSYSFSDLIPARYSMRVDHSKYSYETFQEIEVAPGKITKLDVTLVLPSSISGKLTLRTLNEPARGITVTARGPRPMTAVTAYDGSFYLGDLKPGKYQIECTAEGILPYISDKPIEIGENQNVEQISISVDLKAPEFHISMYRHTFLPEDKISIELRSFRIARINFAVYKIPVNLILGNLWQRKISTGDFREFEKIKEWTYEVKDFHPYRWIYNTADIAERFPEGVYVLNAADGQNSFQDVFYVTQLGILCKRDIGKIAVYATHLKDNKPLENVDVYLLPATGQTDENWNKILNAPLHPSGKTDANGLIVLKSPGTEDNYSVVAIDPRGSIAVASSPLAAAAYQDKKIFVYTDRPVYRPGQTVYFKAIVRNAGQEMTPAVKENVSAVIYDPTNAKVYEKALTTNELGSINDKLALPDSVGTFIIKVAYGRTTGIAHFFVEEYRKPEFKVKVSTDKPFYVSGETIKFLVSAEYYFGAPVINSKVSYRIYETKINVNEEATWWERYYSRESYHKLVKTGETRTNLEGLADISYQPGKEPYDRKIAIELDVVDASNRTVTGTRSVTLGIGKFYLKIKPGKMIYSQKDWVTIAVGAFDYEDKPVSTKIHAEILQDVWNPVFGVYTAPNRPVATAEVQTGPDGWTTITFQQIKEARGQLRVYCSSTDDLGNKISSSGSFWVYSGYDETYQYNYQSMEMFLDRDQYKVGDTIEILLNTKYENSFFLLTVEGREIYESSVQKFQGRSKILRIPVKKEYAPQIEISVSSQYGKDLITRSRTVRIPVEGKRLKIDVTTDRAQYRPGDKGIFYLATRDENNRPVSAEISLGVVDEAIYAIREDFTPDIFSFFHLEQPNCVSTTYSYPITYLAGASKESREPVRENFQDTALWIADIVTDRQGKAAVPIIYPDNLTTWRATFRGHTVTTEVGTAKVETLVTKELVARLELPRFFLEGDRIGIIGVINNLTTTNLADVSATLKLNERLKLVSAAEKHFSIAANASSKQAWEISVAPGKGDARLELDASGGAFSDRVLLKCPVHLFGVKQEEQKSGECEERSKEITMAPPAGARYIVNDLEIALSPSIASACIASLEYLATYPYGCMEQIINSFFPNLVLMDVLKTAGIPGTGLDAETVKQNLRKIYEGQNPEGGWGWWGRDESNYYLTSYAVYCLHMIKKLGFQVDEGVFRKAVQRLKIALHQSYSRDLESYILYVLTEIGEKDEIITGELYGNIGSLNSFDLACLACALSNQGDREKAQKAAKLLCEKMKEKDAVAYWEPVYGQVWGWPGGSAEITAKALTALLKCDYKDAPINKIVRALIEQKTGRRWRSTKETASIILALSEYLKKHAEEELQPDYEFKVYVNEKLIGSGNVSRETMFTSGLFSFHAGQAAASGKNRVKIIKNGKGKLFYSAALDGIITGREIKPRTYGNDLKISRQYFRVFRVRDRKGNPFLMTRALKDGEKLKPGDQLMVKLTLESAVPYEFMVLEDYIPSGFEVTDESVYGGSNPDEEYEFYQLPSYSRRERRDNRMVYFFNSLRKGKTEIACILRAELPGNFRASPAVISCLYAPEISAYSGSGYLVVEK